MRSHFYAHSQKRIIQIQYVCLLVSVSSDHRFEDHCFQSSRKANYFQYFHKYFQHERCRIMVNQVVLHLSCDRSSEINEKIFILCQIPVCYFKILTRTLKISQSTAKISANITILLFQENLVNFSPNPKPGNKIIVGNLNFWRGPKFPLPPPKKRKL